MVKNYEPLKFRDSKSKRYMPQIFQFKFCPMRIDDEQEHEGDPLDVANEMCVSIYELTPTLSLQNSIRFKNYWQLRRNLKEQIWQTTLLLVLLQLYRQVRCINVQKEVYNRSTQKVGCISKSQKLSWPTAKQET